METSCGHSYTRKTEEVKKNKSCTSGDATGQQVNTRGLSKAEGRGERSASPESPEKKSKAVSTHHRHAG